MLAECGGSVWFRRRRLGRCEMEVRGPVVRLVDAVIIGMGYVGLPLAREASAAGLSVIGLDTSP